MQPERYTLEVLTLFFSFFKKKATLPYQTSLLSPIYNSFAYLNDTKL